MRPVARDGAFSAKVPGRSADPSLLRFGESVPGVSQPKLRSGGGWLGFLNTVRTERFKDILDLRPILTELPRAA